MSMFQLHHPHIMHDCILIYCIHTYVQFLLTICFEMLNRNQSCRSINYDSIPACGLGLRSSVVRYTPVAWPRHLLRFIKSLLETLGVLTSYGLQSHSSRSALTSRGASRSDTLTGTAAVESRLGTATIASPPVGCTSGADC